MIGRNSEDMKSIIVRGQLPAEDSEDTNVTWVDLPHQSTVHRIRKFMGNFRTDPIVSESIVEFIEALELRNDQCD